MSKYIIANWKSNHSLDSAWDWVETVNSYLTGHNRENVNVILAPPFSLIAGLAIQIQGSPLKLAVQDLSQFGAGSYTGEVCAQNLEGLFIERAILGHSERRRYFDESDEIVAAKVKEAVENGISPIVCVDKAYLESQLEAIKKMGVDLPNSGAIMAYEPLAAIGSGEAADVDEAAKVVEQIKGLYGTMVIYGGSVDEKNIEQFLQISDGVLVGTASLTADSFIGLLEAIKE
jgi:triosephosphate isomerase (TIM)